jgi:flagellar hook protein FlgE
MFFRSLLYEKFKNHFNPNYILEKKIDFMDFNETDLQLIKSGFTRVQKERRRDRNRLKKHSERRIKTERSHVPKTSLTLTKDKDKDNHSPKRFSTQMENCVAKLNMEILRKKSAEINSCVNFSNSKFYIGEVPRELEKPHIALPRLENSMSQYLSSRELYSVSQSKRSLLAPSSMQSQVHANIVDEEDQSKLQIIKKKCPRTPVSVRRKQLSRRCESQSSNMSGLSEQQLE